MRPASLALVTLFALHAVPSSPAQVTHNWTRTNPGGGGAIAEVGATASGTILSASDLSGVFKSTDDGASWQALGSEQGLNITHTSSLGFHPTDGDIFFVGTGWGIYKTIDGGDHFDFVHTEGYIEDVVIAASDPAIGYMAYHEDWDTAGEVYKTTDGGDSWAAVPGENLPNDLRVVKIMTHAQNPQVVYALGGKTRWGCSAADLYRSTDGGVLWTRIGGSLGSILDMDLHPTNQNTIFASSFLTHPCAPDQSMEDYLAGDENSGALYKSTNAGATWTEIGEQTGIISVDTNPQVIRLATILWPWSWNTEAGIWKTTDGGASWNLDGPATGWDWGWCTNEYFALTSSFNGFSKTLKKDPFRPDRFYGSFGQWAWASLDGGITINNISTRHVAGDRWISTGMENIVGHGLAISESNPDVIYSGIYDLGLWTSRDRGRSWKRTLPDHNLYPGYVWSEGQGSNVTAVLADPDRDGVVWAAFHREGHGNSPGSGTNSALFKSSNHGDSFQISNTGLPNGIMFHGLSLDPNSAQNNRTLYMTADGDVYKSTDDGASWFVVFANGGLKFTSLDSADPSLVYAGGENGLWRSTNAGGSWTEVGPTLMRGPFVGNFIPTGAGWEGVFDVQADPSVAGRVYVVVYGAGKGLYRSNNAGLTWRKLYSNPHMRGVAIAPQNPRVIYATSSVSYHSGGYDPTSAGIVYSRDAGRTWKPANEGMGWLHGGRIRLSPGATPYVIAWTPGPGMQIAPVPFDLKPAFSVKQVHSRPSAAVQ